MKNLLFISLVLILGLVIGCKQTTDDTSVNRNNEEGTVVTEFKENFTEGDKAGSGYDGSYTHTFENTSVVLSATGNNQHRYEDGITVTGNGGLCHISVKGVKGLGTITIKYYPWLGSGDEEGKLNLFIDDALVDTLLFAGADTNVSTHVFTVNRKNATSFTLKPFEGSANGHDRIHIVNVTWTTTN